VPRTYEMKGANKKLVIGSKTKNAENYAMVRCNNKG
jgi:hypothetical protein